MRPDIEPGSIVAITYNSGRKSCTYRGRLMRIGMANVITETLTQSGRTYRIPLKFVRKIEELKE